MNDWITLVLIMFMYAMAVLYMSSRPAWLVSAWRQIEESVRWIGRKMRKRRRSRRGLVVEISANDDGTLSASWAKAMPRPPLPYAQRPLRCALRRHRYMTVWDRADDAPDWWPAIAVVRCTRCGVARP